MNTTGGLLKTAGKKQNTCPGYTMILLPGYSGKKN